VVVAREVFRVLGSLMGLRGPGAKPKELRELEGSASRVVAISTNAVAALPPEMTVEARTVWDDVVATFAPNYFKSADRWHLAAYCDAVVACRRAQGRLLELGEVIEKVTIRKRRGKGRRVQRTVTLRPNPWLQALNSAHTRMTQLGDRLGIGPTRRTLSVEATNRGNRTPAPQSQPRSFFRPPSKVSMT
jgi:phage terminase small subunit